MKIYAMDPLYFEHGLVMSGKPAYPPPLKPGEGVGGRHRCGRTEPGEDILEDLQWEDRESAA